MHRISQRDGSGQGRGRERVAHFYIEDSRVTGETLRRDGENPPAYRIAAIEEEKQRLDLIAVRVPVKAILGVAAAVAERLAHTTDKTAKK